MLRGTILWLSRHKALRRWVETSPLARRVSSRFIAGHSLEDALAACRRLRAESITATLDYLGENVTSLDEAAACRDVYLRILHAMEEAGVEPNVSLKLTQFGLELSEAACEENVGALVKAAAAIGGFVRIDMESSQFTDRTLAMVTRLHERWGACGTVVQAYLRRSAEDIRHMEQERIRVRLCKGAYLEPPEVAFPRNLLSTGTISTWHGACWRMASIRPSPRTTGRSFRRSRSSPPVGRSRATGSSFRCCMASGATNSGGW